MNAQIQTHLKIEKLSPTIGAVLHGVDMGRPVGEELRAEIYQALLDHKVIFFRDQDISTEQHIAFSRLFWRAGGASLHDQQGRIPGSYLHHP